MKMGYSHKYGGKLLLKSINQHHEKYEATMHSSL